MLAVTSVRVRTVDSAAVAVVVAVAGYIWCYCRRLPWLPASIRLIAPLGVHVAAAAAAAVVAAAGSSVWLPGSWPVLREEVQAWHQGWSQM